VNHFEKNILIKQIYLSIYVNWWFPQHIQVVDKKLKSNRAFYKDRYVWHILYKNIIFTNLYTYYNTTFELVASALNSQFYEPIQYQNIFLGNKKYYIYSELRNEFSFYKI